MDIADYNHLRQSILRAGEEGMHDDELKSCLASLVNTVWSAAKSVKALRRGRAELCRDILVVLTGLRPAVLIDYTALDALKLHCILQNLHSSAPRLFQGEPFLNIVPQAFFPENCAYSVRNLWISGRPHHGTSKMTRSFVKFSNQSAENQAAGSE